jgi:hypothetical protein
MEVARYKSILVSIRISIIRSCADTHYVVRNPAALLDNPSLLGGEQLLAHAGAVYTFPRFQYSSGKKYAHGRRVGISHCSVEYLRRKAESISALHFVSSACSLPGIAAIVTWA